MDILDLAIPDVKLMRPRRHGDERGWFMETYRRDLLAAAGIADEFVQDNRSFTAARGAVRGLHLQRRPHAQAKLVSVARGRVLDVAVDVRRGSPTFGRHVAVELGAADGAVLYVPVGFLHGFCTLTPDVLFTYKVSDYYAPNAELGVAWDDPDLAIAWPVSRAEALLSERDRRLPRLAEVEPFD